MASLQIRLDEGLRNEAQSVAQAMGLDLSSAIRMFLAQMVRENGLPFQPRADPFHGSCNQAHLTAVVDSLRHGRNGTAHDPIALGKPRYDAAELDDILAHLAGAIPDSGKSLAEYKAERVLESHENTH